MAWGRKAKRIAELEKELEHTRKNLAIARVSTTYPPLTQDIVVEKGKWYTLSYQFQHSGGPTLNIRDLFVGLDLRSAHPHFFDGSEFPDGPR